LANVIKVIELLEKNYNFDSLLVSMLDQTFLQTTFPTGIFPEELRLLISALQRFDLSKKGLNLKDKVKLYLKIIVEQSPSIDFDLTAFDNNSQIPEEVTFYSKEVRTPISFIAKQGGPHCMLQELPTVLEDANIKLHAPATPNFHIRNLHP
jgi:hypothetical protein